MSNNTTVRSIPPSIAARPRRKRLQAYVLLILGIISLIAAQVLHLNPFAYPIGILVFGVGLLIAFFFNPRHLAVASWMLVFIGLEIYLLFKNVIPGNQTLSTFVFAIGLGLLTVMILSRLGFVGKGAISPVIFVLIFGILEYLLAARLLTTSFASLGFSGLINADSALPTNAFNFLLSLWLPGIGLILFGLYYLVVG